MLSHKYAIRLFRAGKALLLAGTLAATVWLARPAELSPPLLVALLLALAVLGERLSIDISDGQLSATLVAVVIAMSVLGPAPAVACGVIAMVLTSATRRLAPAEWLNNLAAYAVVAFVGGLLVRALSGGVVVPHTHRLTDSATFGLIVFAVFLVVTGLSFALFTIDLRVEGGRSFSRQIRDLGPLLPGELATGALATILAVAYADVGLPMLVASIVILLIFRHLMVALLRSEDRAEHLQARSRQLVGLQLGVLRTLVRALGMRDKTTARHAAAVGRYAKALALELDCSEEEQDVVQAAGLLHEIGKFTWPDRVLHAEVVQKEDLTIVRDHPQEGAILVGALDGYGPVAEAILYHHERVDGRGYPAGLIGQEIPLASRILAICSTYDAMTAGDGYREQMTSEEAIAEMRHAARNGQLDAELVESFIVLLEREGPTFAQGSDFEIELDFERRVRSMAEPASTSPIAHRQQARGDWRSGLRRLRQRALNKA